MNTYFGIKMEQGGRGCDRVSTLKIQTDSFEQALLAMSLEVNTWAEYFAEYCEENGVSNVKAEELLTKGFWKTDDVAGWEGDSVFIAVATTPERAMKTMFEMTTDPDQSEWGW